MSVISHIINYKHIKPQTIEKTNESPTYNCSLCLTDEYEWNEHHAYQYKHRKHQTQALKVHMGTISINTY